MEHMIDRCATGMKMAKLVLDRTASKGPRPPGICDSGTRITRFKLRLKENGGYLKAKPSTEQNLGTAF